MEVATWEGWSFDDGGRIFLGMVLLACVMGDGLDATIYRGTHGVKISGGRRSLMFPLQYKSLGRWTGRRRSSLVVGDLMHFKMFGNKMSDMTICEVFDSAVLPLLLTTRGFVAWLKERSIMCICDTVRTRSGRNEELFRINIATNRAYPSRRSIGNAADSYL